MRLTWDGTSMRCGIIQMNSALTFGVDFDVAPAGLLKRTWMECLPRAPTYLTLEG